MSKENLLSGYQKDTVMDSITIAKCFDKEHKHVMQSIRKILGCAQEMGRNLSCFDPSTYVDSKNRTQPMYYITYTGFLLLVMGFTGTKALEIKLNYIQDNTLIKPKNVKGLLPEIV